MTDAERTCKELTEWITDYTEERLPPTENARLKQHLAHCEGCQTYLDQMRITVRTLGATPPVRNPPILEASLLRAFRAWKR